MALMALATTTSSAQDFVDLTASQLHIDSMLPRVSQFVALPQDYQDSTYTLSLLYPEYKPLTREERQTYQKLSGLRNAPDSVQFNYNIYIDRKKASLGAEFTPIVTHDGQMSFITSYKPQLVATAIDVTSQTAAVTRAQVTMNADAEDSTSTSSVTYATSSVLSSGSWGKIRVSATGITRLTSAVARRAGFSDLSRVHIYGYGGALVPETLTQDYIKSHDDLQEIPTCTVNGEKYFYATGSVSWDSNTSLARTRNPYSDYGYYFITVDDTEPLTCTEEELLAQMDASTDVHHFLYETDNYAWSQTGRNLFDKTEITESSPMTVNVIVPKGNTSANVQVTVSSGSAASYRVTCGSSQTGSLSGFGEYDVAKTATRYFSVNLSDTLQTDDSGNIILPVVIEATNASSTLRLDYVSAYFTTPDSAVALSSSAYPEAEYYCNITNQNLHAHEPVDLLIIIPTSQRTLSQAQALGELHRQYDGMTYRVVPADELYNEFSSGTPDVSAYKRYLKMFYDKAADESEMIKYVCLFGDAVWDNRMNTLSSTTYDADDYLLVYETENSYSTTSSAAIDDFITVMQDGKNIHVDSSDSNDATLQLDVAVGRIPVVYSGDAEIAIDKITHYISNTPDDEWQNEIMFIGDDGDSNSHMKNINDNADDVMSNSPGYYVKKVMLDTYELVSTSTGDTYPEATTAVKKQQNDGALIMNYGGHANWSLISHEKLLVLSDFEEFKGSNYSVWFTAACETVPFDGTLANLGETAFLNSDGGAVAFIGTTRTVYETQNAQIDKRFMARVLEKDSDGNSMTIGEALRQAKNDLIKGNTTAGSERTLNKHQYVILGDPAMRIATPTYTAVIDSINGVSTDTVETVKGNSIVYVKGHIESGDGEITTAFNGTANILVRDSEQLMEGRGNDTSTSTLFTYYDRPGTLFKGTCNVQDGQFSFAFQVPKEINSDGGTGLITIYAKDDTNLLAANGECGSFIAQGWEDVTNDGIGPSIYAYLNTTSFRNGDDVGRTPFFVAEISDNDGINATGASLGHNLELVVDGSAQYTYDLDDNFVFDSGSYTSGQTYYTLPSLDLGDHSLTFKAWDLLGNSNSVSLNFRVVSGMRPELYDVYVAPNPISDVATFYVTHDMQGSEAEVRIDIIDLSGRLVSVLKWSDTFSETSSTTTYRWTPSGLAQGMYLYRVRLTADGSDYVSKTKKLIIAQ